MAGPVSSYVTVLDDSRRAGDPKPWPTLLVIGALWLLNFNQLRVEWSINPQYTYGWTVPFLALYLFAERWKDRPPVSRLHHGAWLAFFLGMLAVCLLPLRVIQEAAPDWRIVSWSMAASTAAISLCAIYFAGGRSWVWHFAVPVLFVLIAVPWPAPIERVLIQGLMSTVARICVEALSFFAIPAVQHGNVIHIATGKVGVEEACSGVRSLQTTLMASIFLGELFRFPILRRSLLLGGGLLLAFLCNLGRSFALVWISVHDSTASALKWHDTIGLVVLVVSLVGLAILCAIIRGKGAAEAVDDAPNEPAWRPRFAPRSMILSAACWLVTVELVTEFWYRSHEGGRTPTPWTVRWPVGAPEFVELPLSEAERVILRFDEGKRAAWSGPDGTKCSMFFLRWLPGRASLQLARSHGPEVCLAASGATLRQDLGVRNMRVAGIDLPMHLYVFGIGDTPLYVFFCLWQDLPPDDGPQSTQQRMTMQTRLRDVFAGRRNTGQQVVELAIAGLTNPLQAEATAARMLEGIVSR